MSFHCFTLSQPTIEHQKKSFFLIQIFRLFLGFSREKVSCLIASSASTVYEFFLGNLPFFLFHCHCKQEMIKTIRCFRRESLLGRNSHFHCRRKIINT